MTNRLVFNGIDGSDGSYLLSPMSLRRLFRQVRERPLRVSDRKRRLRYGEDPRDLASAGWGVVFAHDVPAEVREALKPLVEHRRAVAASRDERRFCDLSLDPAPDVRGLMAQHGSGPGPVDPERLPYYLLLVGSPEAISFRAQFQLGVARAVGRVHFGAAEDYARYAESVIAAETGTPRSTPRATLFGVSHDDSTRWSARHLVKPLAERLAAMHPGWTVEGPRCEDARRAEILDHLGGPSTPDVLFTASHGVGFPAGDRRQERMQGALLCQDWPGPDHPLLREHYLTAEDVTDAVRPAGLISFHFACFGAGTPLRDSFVHRGDGAAETLATKPMVAPLAQRLLSHPRGGSLAYVGHVDRAWGYSFLWNGEEQPEVFVSALSEVLRGYPVGEAMKFFSDRYGELATHLVQALHDERLGQPRPAKEMVAWWTSAQDAAAYAILGDPAVRSRVGGET